MNSVNTSFKNINNHDIILGIILFLYIFGDYQTPTQLCPYITNFVSYVIMIILVTMMLLNSNIIIALLLGITFIILVHRSNISHPVNIMPSESYKETVMNNLNSNNTFNSTNQSKSNEQLEEYIITNMATINYRRENLDNDTFKPTLSSKTNAFEFN
tara:strand:- start:1669 stop:2139 length:471 start_codon:yes stop_codon:yes gene_type:complete